LTTRCSSPTFRKKATKSPKAETSKLRERREEKRREKRREEKKEFNYRKPCGSGLLQLRHS